MAYTTPRTWNEELVSSAKWITELKTNLLAIKDPPSDNYEANEGSDYSATGNTWVDVDTDFNHSLTTTGGAVYISFIGNMTAGGDSPQLAYVDVSVDGTRIVNQTSAGLAVVLTSGLIQFSRIVTGLAAGAHTFNLQWRGNSALITRVLHAGAGTASYDVHPQFYVREMS